MSDLNRKLPSPGKRLIGKIWKFANYDKLSKGGSNSEYVI